METRNRKELEISSWFAVVKAYNECNRRYSQLLRAFELTIPQFDVLSAIRSLGLGATPRAIADELVVTRGNVSGVLHRLQNSGLIATRRDEHDGRSFVCELTERGHQQLSRARRAAAMFIGEQLAPFDDATLQTTASTMNAMRAHLQTLDPDVLVAGLSRPGGAA